jgi:hypothetical protein
MRDKPSLWRVEEKWRRAWLQLFSLSSLSPPGFYSSPAQLRTLHTSRGGGEGVMQGNRKSIKFYEKFCKKDVKKGRERSSDEGRVKYVKKRSMCPLTNKQLK